MKKLILRYQKYFVLFQIVLNNKFNSIYDSHFKVLQKYKLYYDSSNVNMFLGVSVHNYSLNFLINATVHNYPLIF